MLGKQRLLSSCGSLQVATCDVKQNRRIGRSGRAFNLVAHTLQEEPQSISWVSQRCPAEAAFETPGLSLRPSNAL
jgi:hypothetical protein